MRILYIVTWCTAKGSKDLDAGIFHYEQAVSQMKSTDANVAVYYPFDKNIDREFTCETEWGVLTYRSKFYPGNPFKSRKNIKRMMAYIIEKFRPDVLHAHCAAGAGYYAVDYGKKYNLPVVITEHTPFEISNSDKFGMSYLLSKKAYSKSDANICVSKDSMNKLSARFKGCDFDVIYNGIILPKYENTSKYYKEGYLNIAIVALLYDLEVKGLKYLLGAIAQLVKKGKKVHLHHIGNGQYLEHFQNLAKELGIEENVTFYGKCDRQKLYEIVNEMDMFCSSSLTESGGVSVQEAMLLGKPVLGTNSGGVDSLVPDFAGHIVQKASSDALANGIEYMEEKLPEFDSEKIRSYAFDHFEIDHISDCYMKLYKRLIDARK